MKKVKQWIFSETIVAFDLKLATDDRSDKKFLLTSKLCPLGGCMLPAPGLHVCVSLYIRNLSWSTDIHTVYWSASLTNIPFPLRSHFMRFSTTSYSFKLEDDYRFCNNVRRRCVISTTFWLGVAQISSHNTARVSIVTVKDTMFLLYACSSLL